MPIIILYVGACVKPYVSSVFRMIQFKQKNCIIQIEFIVSVVIEKEILSKIFRGIKVIDVIHICEAGK